MGVTKKGSLMKKKFNLSAYKELLELRDSGKIVFLDKNSLELLNYRASISRQILYDRKADYFLLIHEYLTRVITIYEFQSKLVEIEKEASRKATIILENSLELERFFLAEDSDKFSNLVCEISQLCFDYYEDWDGTIKPMLEAELYHLVNNLYLQLQEAFPFENSNNQTYKHLVSRSFKFLILTVGLELLAANFINSF